MLNKFYSIFFKVDSRALGLYRILLGWLCFWDIFRRWDFINIFYTDLGIKTQYAKNSSFSIFNFFGNDPVLVYLIFIIGIVFSIFLMIGFNTKLSHSIVTLIIISIHVSVTKVGNSGDMFMNCILIWTLFLPLGKSISFDSLINSLKSCKENNLKELNDKSFGITKPKQIFSLAYFAMLFQLCAIYFFTALDKHGYDWTEGTAFYKMLQLDGFITSVITSGTPPFNYIWSNNYTTQDVTNLGNGTYSLLVTDSNGCTASASYSINALEAPVLELVVINPTGCNTNDGQVTTNVTGGSGNYFYDWDVDDLGDFDDNANLENLSPGNYNLNVQDANGCSSSASFSIASATPPVLILNGINVSCFGDNNGLVSVSLTGDNGPFSYSWSNGDSSAVISGLNAGMYELTITDFIGCQAMDSIEILEPEELIFDSVISLDPSCLNISDGSIEIFASGGVGSYSYLWENGNTSSSINNLLSGDYTITVLDENGCVLDSTINIMGASGPQTGDILGNTQVLSNSISQYSVSQNLNSIYNWSIVNGNVLSGQGTNTISVQWGLNGFGQIDVIETDLMGCTGDTISNVITINSGLGLLNEVNNNQINVYPNPTNGDFTINITRYNGKFKAELFDIMGRTLLISNSKNMSLADYPDGLYFLRVYFDDKVQDIRLIKN